MRSGIPPHALRRCALRRMAAMRRAHPRSALGIVLFALLAAPAGAPVAKGQTPSLAVAPEPAIVLQIRPSALSDGAPLLRSLLLLWPQGAAALGAAQSALGLDFLHPGSLEQRGIDPRAPLLIEGFALSRSDVEKAYLSAKDALLRRDWRGLRSLPGTGSPHASTIPCVSQGSSQTRSMPRSSCSMLGS